MLNTSIDNLPNTSTITKHRLLKLGIKTYWDLLNYFPYRYNNYSLISAIDKLQIGEIATVKGQIVDGKYQITRNGTRIQKFIVQDNTGKLDVLWFNQPYLLRLLKPGILISISGLIQNNGKRLTIESPEYEIIRNDKITIHTGRIVPVYSEKVGLSSKTIREKIFKIINENNLIISEYLPQEIIRFNSLIDVDAAYRNIHFPQDLNMEKQARNRLVFDELFIIQLSAALIKKDWLKDKIKNFFNLDNINLKKINEFIDNLPFKLTQSQEKAVSEILRDLEKSIPMNRFLEGDVGSGKTVVAAIACFAAYLNRYQSLIMAPTEILAQQHYVTLNEIFMKYKLNVGLQTSSKKINNKSTDTVTKSLTDFHIIVGTHALIQKKLKFSDVGLVVIDEQHRFGVKQRTLLKQKAINPHLLTMTATPIPRTVMLTLYGELDMSVIIDMPKGRIPIKTYLVPKNKREAGYEWIKKQITPHKTQVFIVCPLIEQSEIETMVSLKAAKKEYELLKNIVFKNFKVGLLHGKLKSIEKELIMKDFKSRKYDILVSTSVVEVGIDIPNATIMVIEGADRFGLAQLHQLRGRVGRGIKQSYCLLFTDKEEINTTNRLKYFSQNHNGIALAEYDLKTRGPGDIYGVKQHGYLNLRLASLSDFHLINNTKNAAKWFISKFSILDQFPEIKKRVGDYQAKQISSD